MFVLHCVFTLRLSVFPQNSSVELWNNYFGAIKNSLKKVGTRMAEESISLHRYIRNTPSDRSACRTPVQSRQEDLTKGKGV